MTYPPRCLLCGYVLLGLPAGRCPECGSPFNPDDPATFSSKPLYVWWQYWLPGFLLASIGGSALFALLLVVSGWGVAVTIAAPIAVGAALGYGCRVRPMLRVVFSILALAIIVIALFTIGFTGIFCGLVLAAVTMIPVLLGAWMGAALRARLKNSQFEQRWYLPIFVLWICVFIFGCIERVVHRPFAIESVVTRIDIPAPVGRTWNAVMFYEEVHPFSNESIHLFMSQSAAMNGRPLATSC